MRRSIRDSRALAKPYRDLVWLAYLALPAWTGDHRRVVLAHRLAAATLSRHQDEEPVRLRALLLRAALRARPRPWSGRLATVEAVPAVTRSGDVDFTRALEAVPAPARAAYALLRLEERPADEIAQVLTEAGVSDPAGALAAVAEMEERFGASAALHRPAADPCLARLYGRLDVEAPRRLVAGLVFCVVAVLAAVPWLGADRPSSAASPQATPSTAAPEAWRTTTELDLGTWPPRGDLLSDRALIARALRAWGPRHPQLLYAGRFGATTVVLLRRHSQVARYVETGGRPTLEVLPEPGGGSPLKLTTTAKGSRYLLPPWVTEAATAPFDGGWRPAAIDDGMIGPVPVLREGGCWRGPLVRLRAPEVPPGLPYTVVDLGRLAPARIGYRGRGPLAGAWRRLGCALPRPVSEVREASAWSFRSVRLPEGARGEWMCVRLTDPSGRGAVQAVLLATSGGRTTATRTGVTHGTWDCSRLAPDIAATVWWSAPSGRHYRVSAASMGVTVEDDRATNADGETVTILR
ncbi:hypothetical protein [Nonomuraea africana]|uniref:DNA-directed RNA polymerase specialized sigma24 family protein n=1 Tax=Nonomuraea africana TaxID=46171 RepID=A0ABR9KVV8_9ACTN|nr:hypothetical protein [Nonomuraea africana]MBE1566168.1 hypothetical protein [Nonomuraea africana]